MGDGSLHQNEAEEEECPGAGIGLNPDKWLVGMVVGWARGERADVVHVHKDFIHTSRLLRCGLLNFFLLLFCGRVDWWRRYPLERCVQDSVRYGVRLRGAWPWSMVR